MKKCLTLIVCLFAAFSGRSQTSYNYYYGNLHAHSSYSDGNADAATSGHATPFQNYVYARASLHFDFLGISEHNHSQAGMQKINYAKGLRQADSATINGQFVALYGMEWGVISTGGHVLVYGVDSLLGWETNNHDVFVAKTDYQGLFRQINKRPAAFATLAHPTSSDFGNIAAAATAFSARADSAIVGTVMRSGPAFSSNFTYSNASTGSFESYYRTLLAKGYHVGISLDHDNHNTTFGRTTDARVVALAPSLTKADIMMAFKERRFYASDDWNAQVNFTLNGQPLGKIFSGNAPATISLNITDADANDQVQSINLLKGVPGSGSNAWPVATTGAGISTLSYVDPSPAGNAYYYAVIIQQDGDRIVTSPIWYNRTTATGLEEQQEQLAFNVFPNPASGGPVTVSFFLNNPETVTLELVDALGRVITVLAGKEALQPGSQNITIDPVALRLKKGVYTIRLIHNGSVNYRKLIIMN